MECNNCKKTIPDDSKFCVFCGEKIEDILEKISENNEEKQVMPKVVKDIRNHLEFMGFELNDNIVEDNDVIRFVAMNKNRPNFIVSYIALANTVLFVSVFTIPKINSETKKNQLLKTANQINNNLSVISAFSISDDFKSINISACYPDEYSKKEFSNFLEYFQNEINRITNFEDLKEFV